jgi:hypothetical protein
MREFNILDTFCMSEDFRGGLTTDMQQSQIAFSPKVPLVATDHIFLKSVIKCPIAIILKQSHSV